MRVSTFAFLPRGNAQNPKSYLHYIAEYALKENWGEDLRTLERYVDYNFEIAFAQGLVLESPDKEWALWRVGNLVTRENDPISILCMKNRKSGLQPYYFTRVFRTSRVTIQVGDAEKIVAVPAAPTYDSAAYRSEYKLSYNFAHYLSDNKERAELALPGLTENQRFLCVYASAHLAHQRGRSAAVRQWFRDKNAESGGFQWLLPLHITNEDISGRPDFVATLDPDDANQEYRVRTLLPPEWAYPHARAVSDHDPQFRAWA